MNMLCFTFSLNVFWKMALLSYTGRVHDGRACGSMSCVIQAAAQWECEACIIWHCAACEKEKK